MPEISHKPGEGVTVKYEFAHPIEIAKFNESLEGLAELYRMQVAKDVTVSKNLRLYIKEIRKGSVEVDLVEMIRVAGGALAPIAADAKVIVDAVQRARQVIDWISGSSASAVTEPIKKEVEAVSHFVAPIAENNGSTVQISVNNSPGAQIFIGSPDAINIREKAAQAIEVMNTPQISHLREVPLVWVQTDRDGATSGRSGSKAIVEAASQTALPVYFCDERREELMAAMVSGVEYPYQKTFIVDLETIVVQGKLKGYRILKLHDTLDG